MTFLVIVVNLSNYWSTYYITSDFLSNHNHYKFLKYYWCTRSFIFHKSFCTVVIGQCNRIIGCVFVGVFDFSEIEIVMINW